MTEKAVDHLIERLDGLAPSTALVLGSGLGVLVDRIEHPIRVPYADLPGFPTTSVPSPVTRRLRCCSSDISAKPRLVTL